MQAARRQRTAHARAGPYPDTISVDRLKKNDARNPSKDKSSSDRGSSVAPGVGSYRLSSSLVLNKKLGQHLLKSDGVLEKIVAAAEIRSSDTVLEIGPGTGNLTLKLLPLARRVRAMDIDERMVASVKKRALSMGYSSLDVCVGDVLRVESLGHFDVCVANLPYQISSKFVFKLVKSSSFRCAVLMFQKEFAERLCAKPNESSYCRLSVNTQLFCSVNRVCLVKAKSFQPPPKVDSMVVKLVPRKKKIEVDFAEWDGMLRLCFNRKRRELRSNLKSKAVLSLLQNNWLEGKSEKAEVSSLVDEILKEYEGRRTISLSLEELLDLLVKFNQIGIRFSNSSGGGGATMEDDLSESDNEDL